MNKNLKLASEQYKTTIKDKIRTIEVPELPDADGNPMVIHVRPATLKDLREFQSVEHESEIDLLVNTILVRSVDEDGKRLFTTDEDKDFFYSCLDPEVVSRVGMEINEDLVGGEESNKAKFAEAEKN